MKLTQRGWRECSDLIEEAQRQGWTLRKAGTSHLRLIPPDSNATPVGIAGTPSDKNQRRQVIRLMRRSGFTWPPPPKPERITEPTITIAEPVETTPAAKEEWQPVLIEGVKEGYEVNAEGQIIDRSDGWAVIPFYDKQLALVYLMNANPQEGHAVCRLDEIVLEAFEVRPSPQHIAEHIDGDQMNCRRENLRWVLPEEPKLDELVPLTDLGLSARTQAALEPVLYSVNTLVECSERDLMGIKGLSMRGIAEIKSKLCARGLKLAEADPDTPLKVFLPEPKEEPEPQQEPKKEKPMPKTEPEQAVPDDAWNLVPPAWNLVDVLTTFHHPASGLSIEIGSDKVIIQRNFDSTVDGVARPSLILSHDELVSLGDIIEAIKERKK